MFYGLSNQDLKDGFYLKFKVKEVSVFVINLDLLIISLRVRHEDGRGGSVDVIVRLELVFIYHVLMVAEFLPRVLVLQFNHLSSVIFFLHNLLVPHIVFFPFLKD
jgi:hypothetical protein